MSDERRMEVLRVIVQDYVSTREPVGSRAIVERHHLGVSPATVRNDMAYLEECGYIMQPHTSAGRVPTDKGYRHFVDQIATLKPLSVAERRAIESFLSGAIDLDQVLERTARSLAHLTHLVAIIQYPSLQRSALRHLEIVRLAEHHLLLVVITENGRVEQRTIEFPGTLPDLEPLRARLNEKLVGLRLSGLAEPLAALAEELPPDLRPLLEAIGPQLVEMMRSDTEERIVMAGTANLARSTTDFQRSIGPVLEALEEQVVMLRLLSEMAKEIAVRIGTENRHEGLSEASLVTATYGDGPAGGGPVGALAVLGPTRMDYPGTMAAVRAVARYVSQILNTP